MSIQSLAETQLAPISFLKVAWKMQEEQKVGEGDGGGRAAYERAWGKLETNAWSREGKKLRRGGNTQ